MAFRRVRQWHPELPVGDRVDPRGVMPEHLVTEAVIDEAVEGVLRDSGMTTGRKEVMRALMAADVNSPVAHAYYAGVSSAGMQQAHVRSLRRELVIPYDMTDAQQAAVAAYASEFKLAFRSTDMHDHPMAAAYRLVDQMTVESRIPPGVGYSDIGGSAIRLAKSGNLNAHVCRPDVDKKDPARMVLQRLQLKRISVDESMADSVRMLAAAVSSDDPRYICGKIAQKCDFQTRVALSVHVYDIPIEDWPVIMERKGVQLVEGCMLFSNRVFHENVGLFEAADVRYELDKAADVFKMGFVGSPAWWYSHKLTDYLRYGADQILYGKKKVYSYKIVERRGDTIFFRILPVGSATIADRKQVFKLPGVPMVRVRGYDSYPPNPNAQRLVKEWNWPAPLWDDMVSHAAEQVERNAFDVERMFNYYRSVAPRQTINSVLVAGGYTVEMDELVALVIHSSLTAMMQVLRSQLTLKAVIDTTMARRRATAVSGFQALVAALNRISVDGFTYFSTRLGGLLGWLRSNTTGDIDESFVSEWEPVVQVRLMPAEIVLGRKWRADASWAKDYREPDFSVQVRSVAPMDLLTAAAKDPVAAHVVTDMFGSALPGDVLELFKKQVDKYNSTYEEPEGDGRVGYAETLTSTRGVSSAVPSVGSLAVRASSVEEQTVHKRRAAIQEAIVEIELERRQVEASCGSAYLDLQVEGSPSARLCRSRAEIYYNPDFWYISGGYLTKSLLGRAASEFEQSAVFTPIADPTTGSRLRPVQSTFYEGSSRGRNVVREHVSISGASYTGWAYTSDALAIYNGPEVVDALRQSLTTPMDFEIILEQGPPGCGKTTAIVKQLQKEGIVLGAVRLSVAETRGRIEQTRPGLRFPVKERVRTLDSYLVNFTKQKSVRAMTAEVLRIDEVFMCHSGKWYAAMALLGCSRAFVYGDQFQIPHVPRAAAPDMYVRVWSDSVHETWISYRCPADAVASWADIYDYRVRSASAVRKSLSQVTTSKSMPIPPGCVMMGAYQADKVELRRLYGSCGVPIKIMTIHESQGNTYEHVWLHRFDSRRREKTDRTSLYDRQEYALVAMSRHTHSFVYIRPGTVEDEVSRRVVQGQVRRRIEAAADVDSAGERKMLI